MISGWLYRAILRCLPGNFDRDEMWETYRARVARATVERGRAAAARERLTELLDLIETVFTTRWPLPSLDSLGQDVRIGLRSLRRSPLASGLAVLSLALGIGATTAIYSAVDVFLFRPLPLPNAERLVSVWMADRERGSINTLSVRDYHDWSQASRSVTLMAYAPTGYNVAVDGQASRIRGLVVSANALDVLGILPARGRTFTPVEGTPRGERVALLSDAFWRSAFGAAADAVGATVVLDDVPHTVIGVLPPRQGIPLSGARPAVWTPFRISGSEPRSGHYLRGAGLLTAGADLRAAQSELDRVAASVFEQDPQALFPDARVQPLRDEIFSPDSRQGSILLAAAALFVLLIACANITNILLARGLLRRHEMAVRGALGAGRRRLLQQLLVESALVAAAGGALGVALGYVGTSLLRTYVLPAAYVAGWEEIALNGRVLGGAAVLTGLALLTFGLLPAARASHLDVRERLIEGRLGGAHGRRSRLGPALVVGEIAVTLTLVALTGLLVRSLVSLRSVDAGMRTSGALVFQVDLPAASPPEPAGVTAFYDELAERLRALPGVAGMTTTSGHILSYWSTTLYSVGGAPDSQTRASAEYRAVTPSYLEVMGLDMLAGRWLDATVDVDGGPPVAVVSGALATRWWPDPEQAIGAIIRLGDLTKQIVGVVDPGRLRGPIDPSPPAIFVPFAQAPARSTFHVLAHSMDHARAVAAARDVLRELNPNLALFDAQSIEDTLVHDALGPVPSATLVFAALGGLALVLMLGGVYGAVAHSVGRRTREMGLRMALGAHGGAVVRMVVWTSAKLGFLGIGIGLSLSLASGQAVAFLLYGVSPRDPVVLAAVSATVIGVVLTAAYLPARRAAVIDPAETLRAE